MKKTLLILFTALALISVVATLLTTARMALASRQVEAENQTTPDIVPELAATSRLEIIPLYEAASASGELDSGHGVSYLIRTDSATILLDVGNNPDRLATAPIMANIEKLGIAWKEISRIVISHPHPDHVGGNNAWMGRTVAIGDLELPGSLDDRLVFVPTPVKFKGAVHATVPSLPAPDIATTGVIAFRESFPFSLLTPVGSEQALVVRVAGKGLVLITGCGHPGLETMVERAETLYGEPVVGVVGGLHYVDQTAEEVQPHIQFLQSRQPGLVALSPHDSSPAVLEAFASAFPGAYQSVAVGQAIQFP